MNSVFKRVDKNIIKNIKKEFKQKEFLIPEQSLDIDSEMLDEAIKKNVELIVSIQEKQTDNLEAAVLSAVTGGSNFKTVVEEVEKQAKRGKAFAEMVARDQVAKTYAAVNEERSKQTGFTGYEWIATNDGKTRPTHAALHGTFQDWSKPPLIKGEGKTPDRNLHPGEDFNCRCIAVPAFQPE